VPALRQHASNQRRATEYHTSGLVPSDGVALRGGRSDQHSLINADQPLLNVGQRTEFDDPLVPQCRHPTGGVDGTKSAAHFGSNHFKAADCTRTNMGSSSCRGPGEIPATTPTRATRRVLIVDEHPIVRLGLRQVIDTATDLSVCGEVDTPRAAQVLLHQQMPPPDVIVSELCFSHGDGIELIRHIRRHIRTVPILVVSRYEETLFAARVLTAGAQGYLTKETSGPQLLTALRQVLDGGIFVSAAVSSALVARMTRKGSSGRLSFGNQLSNREIQVVHTLGQGWNTRAIAHSLHISLKTVESHRRRIQHKLKLRSATQLVHYALTVFSEAARPHPGTRDLPVTGDAGFLGH
jgi:DNA-binding NarL/FixJ family response regulator